jgi:hypothetical protein
MSYEQILKLNKIIEELRKTTEEIKHEKLELQKKNKRLLQSVDEISTENSLLRSFLELAKQEKNEHDVLKKRAEDAEEKVRTMEYNQSQFKLLLEKSIDEIQQLIKDIL